MENTSYSLSDWLQVLRRRRKAIILTGLLLVLGSLAIAVLIPSVYRSTATILIEEQEVPSDLVRSTITSYADQTIERIKAQIINRSRLWPVIEELELYEDLRKKKTSEQVVQEFIDNILVEVLSADVMDRRTGRTTQATIAFSLSFDGYAPGTVQKVTNRLTSLFLGENLKTRERQAQVTTEFLKQETEKLGAVVKQLEEQIAKFKKKARGALPELVQFNMQMLNGLERQLIDLRQKIRFEEERKELFLAQIETLQKHGVLPGVAGEVPTDLHVQLNALRAEFATKQASLSREHPDIIKLQQEIRALEQDFGIMGNVEEVKLQLREARTKEGTLLQQYSAEHPDVSRIRGLIAALESQIAELGKVSQNTPSLPHPDAINAQAKYDSTVATIAQLQEAMKRLEVRIIEHQRRLEKTPDFEPLYQSLVRDRDDATKKYHDLRARLLEAQVSEGMELERKGERFSLIVPPNLPQTPESPNRPAIILLGLLFSLVAGVGAGIATEMLDSTVYSVYILQQVTHVAPLGVIPYLNQEEELETGRRQTRVWAIVGMALLAGLFLLIHVLWYPLDVLWFLLLRKANLD